MKTLTLSALFPPMNCFHRYMKTNQIRSKILYTKNPNTEDKDKFDHFGSSKEESSKNKQYVRFKNIENKHKNYIGHTENENLYKNSSSQNQKS